MKMFQMDCLICMGSHTSKDCGERKLQHCKDCHVYIRHSSDHSVVCTNKGWIYDVYDGLYASIPRQRCNIGIDSDFRFFYGDTWRKPVEGIDAYSTTNGVYFSFKTDKDISLLSNGFAHARILVVVKGADGSFSQKLVLMTSQRKMMVAIPMDTLFDRANAKHTHQSDTSLILTVPGVCSPVISISLFPVNGEARHYAIRFDNATQTFAIPDELKIEAAMPTVNAAEHCTTVAEFQENFTRSFKEAVFQQQQNGRCFECHIPAKRVDDHAENCGSKWYVSRYEDIYVKIPAVRCVLRLGQPVRILKDGDFVEVPIDCTWFSPMADVLFKISAAGTIKILTSAFTRIRVPIVVDVVGATMKEKLVFVTSADRTMVCANSSRMCHPINAIGQFKSNTPIVLGIVGDVNTVLHVEIHSRGAYVHHYDIPLVFTDREGKFKIPEELDIASSKFNAASFDADIPQKKSKRFA